jgi:hypothetical protein
MVVRRGRDWIDSRSTSTIQWLLIACVFLFVWGLGTHGTFAGSGDEPHYQMIAHSLVFDRDVDLSNDYANPNNLVGAGNLKPEAHAIPGKGGRLRPVHDIGLPVLFAPYFAAAYWIADHSAEWVSPRLMARARLNPPLVLRHLLSLGMIAIAALMAALLFRVCRSMCETHAPAMLWTLLCVLSPPLLSHSYLFFTEVPTAFVVTACWLALHTPFHQSRVRTALLGSAVGFLLLLHIRNVGLVLALTGLFLVGLRQGQRRVTRALWFLAPVAGFVAIRTFVNYLFWGTLITSPHAAPAALGTASATVVGVVTRVCGLLIDQEHGLLAYAPLYLLALPGALCTYEVDRRRFREAFVLVGAYLVPVLLPSINPHGWDGGWSPAARFLVPITPILIVLAFGYVARIKRIPRVLSVLFLSQVLLDLVYWSHPKLLWNLGTGRSALAEFLSPQGFHLADWLPCWHAPSLYTVGASALAVTVWIAVSVRTVAHRRMVG